MARRKDRRQSRVRFIGAEPVRVGSLRHDLGDDSIETRGDGISGRLEQRPPRRRERSTKPLPLSDLQILQALACYDPLWNLAAAIDASVVPTSGPGRKRSCLTVEVLLFEQATWELRSYRAVERAFADPTIS